MIHLNKLAFCNTSFKQNFDQLYIFLTVEFTFRDCQDLCYECENKQGKKNKNMDSYF